MKLSPPPSLLTILSSTCLLIATAAVAFDKVEHIEEIVLNIERSAKVFQNDLEWQLIGMKSNLRGLFYDLEASVGADFDELASELKKFEVAAEDATAVLDRKLDELNDRVEAASTHTGSRLNGIETLLKSVLASLQPLAEGKGRFVQT